MDLNLRGKVAVVTGGAGGIGLAVALAFAQEGCRIAICDINPQNMDNAVKKFQDAGYEFITKIVDVSNYKEIHEFADDICAHFGKIDIWVNNAGIGLISFILDMDPADWRRIMQINLDSMCWGIQAAGKHMRKGGGGVILNTSSYSAKISSSRRAAYAITKAGINILTVAAAGELAPYNIRVNAIAPGTIEAAGLFDLPPDEKEKFVSRIALQRSCSPEELARTYLFLGSDAASYITGAIVAVDGGKLCIQDLDVAWGAAEKP